MDAKAWAERSVDAVFTVEDDDDELPEDDGEPEASGLP